jgi:two-component system invasion response regulator UvrY
MISIYVVDDLDLVRAGVRSMLEAEDDLQVLGDFESGEALLSACRESDPPDVVLMDVNMPGIGGIEATRRLVSVHPGVRVIAVTVLDDDPFPSKLLDAGACGYLSKSSSRDEMLEAIRTVVQGHHFIASEVAKKLTLSNIRNSGGSSPLSRLTARELQVMMMVIKGHRNQEISDALFLSPKTVYTYRARVFEKLDVANDVELTHFGIRHGLIDPAP